MTPRARGRIATQGLLALAAATLLLAGCGQKKQAASNAVQMRDMEVVDGTVNDAMTDLDAVSASGTGVGNNNAGNAAAPARKPSTAPEGAARNAEAVPSE